MELEPVSEKIYEIIRLAQNRAVTKRLKNMERLLFLFAIAFFYQAIQPFLLGDQITPVQAQTPAPSVYIRPVSNHLPLYERNWPDIEVIYTAPEGIAGI